ncbi:MAG: hypothetical protein GAK33_04869 [Burkholderia lata]|uniref:Uncharacterized protein n=1 Tax=Burkholderia lata (strain ATCC 17760 / DSM 23089 / LMG 22485 / NCIMB 9086 / R18194 / 383) TaxID=482957 RepID=A0A833PSW3_BURL3|nr:MAG: hypothetical protein GAK33_04869 [Burkholderia lata]
MTLADFIEANLADLVQNSISKPKSGFAAPLDEH